MLQYDARTGRYVDASMMPTQTMAPVSAFQGQSTTPSNLQRFYDEVAFYTGQPAARQAVIAAAPQPAQPLVGVEAPQTVLSQPSVLDTTRQAPAPMQQPVSAPTGQSQIMTRAAVPEAQREPQPTQEGGPGAEEIIQDVATDAIVDVAKDEIKKEIGLEVGEEVIKAGAEDLYPGSTQGGGAGIGGNIAEGAGWAAAAYNVSDAINNIKNDSRRGKGAVEGFYTTSGAVIGGIIGAGFGMPGVGAGIGSVIGRTVGRGWASLGESLGFIGGRSTTQYQIDRWTAAMERASTTEEQKWIARKMNEVIERKESGKAPIVEHGPLAGRKHSIEDLHGMGRGVDVWGEYAFFEAFPDWLTGWTEEERRIIAEAAIREKLLTSDKGSMLFSGKHGKLARIQEIGYQVKQGTYTHAVSDEQRMQDRAAYAQQIGVDWDPSMDAETDKRRVGEHMQMIAAERREEAAIRAEEQGFQKVQGQALWKPNSEKDGNLVMLFPYTVGEVTIRDADTGQVLAVGRSSGPSNGFADTIRFDRPGGAFQNVIAEDKYGNQIPISDGSQRMEGISVTGYVLPGAGVGPLPNFGPPPAVTIPELKPLKKIKYKKRELPKVTYQAPKAPGAQQSKEKQ